MCNGILESPIRIKLISRVKNIEKVILAFLWSCFDVKSEPKFENSPVPLDYVIYFIANHMKHAAMYFSYSCTLHWVS